jgi:hypothetical protein
MSRIEWQPHREPLRVTLVRTVAIAAAAGVIFSLSSGRGLGLGRGLGRWPLATLLMLWPSFGGHWVDLWFLNWLRPRIPAGRAVQIVARLAVWFVGGIALALGMYVTALVLVGFGPERWPAWWLGGAGFILVELIAQLGLQLRGRRSFYNGQG